MFNFDPRQYSITGAFTPEPVPENWYKVIGRKTNIKPTKDQQNGYLNLEMEIIEGSYAGRILFWNFNIFHSNPQTVEIAFKQLAALCSVLGRFEPWSAQGVQDNAAPILHNVPFFVRAIIAQGPSGPLNNIKDIRDQYGAEPGKPGTGQGMPGGMTGAPPPAYGMPQPMASPQWGQQPAPAAPPAQAPGWNGPQPGAPPQPVQAPQPAPGQWAGPQQPMAPAPAQAPPQPAWGGQQPAQPAMPGGQAPAWSGTPSAMPGGWGQNPAPAPAQAPGGWAAPQGPGGPAPAPTGFPGQQPAPAPAPTGQGWPGAQAPQPAPQQFAPGPQPGKPW